MERTAHRRERYDTATIYDIEQALARSRGPSNMEHDAHGRDEIADDAVPLFLSEPHEPTPGEFIAGYDYKPRRRFRGLLFVGTSVVGVGLAAAGYGAAQRSEILDALPGWLHASSSTAPVPAALAAESRQVTTATKEPSRLGEPARVASADPAAAASAPAPSREAIASAYRSALQGQTPQQVATAAAAPAPEQAPAPAPAATAGTMGMTAPAAVDTGPGVATPSAGATAPIIHHLSPAEIASLNKRGDDLIASGDIAAARLVWRRAAEGGDGRAAGKLAGTYDPAVLGRLGVHGMVPDLAKARSWYEKAAQLGSAEARQRLEALARR